MIHNIVKFNLKHNQKIFLNKKTLFCIRSIIHIYQNELKLKISSILIYTINGKFD